MAQNGCIIRKGPRWFLNYWENVSVDGAIVRRRKCVKLAEYGDRYRVPRDLADLVAEKMAGVRGAANVRGPRIPSWATFRTCTCRL